MAIEDKSKMVIKSIRLKNYRSFGEKNNTIELGEITTVIGKNESGKSNLIEALADLKLREITSKNFFNRVNKNSTQNSPLEISLVLVPAKNNREITGETILTITQTGIAIGGALSNCIKTNLAFQRNRKKFDELRSSLAIVFERLRFGDTFTKLCTSIENAETAILVYKRSYFDPILNITSAMPNEYTEFVDYANKCLNYMDKVRDHLPVFIGIDDYSLRSSYSRSELMDDKVEKFMLVHLLNVIGFGVKDLNGYWRLTSEADRANFSHKFNEEIDAKITQKFNNFYKQERIILEAAFENESLNFIVKTVGRYVDYDERSNGLKWYLSMFIQILSKIGSNKIENCVILLDEPGVFLHVNAQKELLSLLEDFAKSGNQVVYTTHSPFMIDTDRLSRVRTIIKDSDGNSNISNKYYSFPSGSGSASETLTPMLIALGMNLSFNISPIDNRKKNVVVEGISDYNYLRTYFELSGEKDDYNVIPSAGVDNIINISSILIGWGFDFRILLDYDKQGKNQYKKLIDKLCLDKSKITFTTGKHDPDDSDGRHMIEDLFSAEDKEKIGINKNDYKDEKALYSLRAFEGVEKGEISFSEETKRAFAGLIKSLN